MKRIRYIAVLLLFVSILAGAASAYAEAGKPGPESGGALDPGPGPSGPSLPGSGPVTPGDRLGGTAGMKDDSSNTRDSLSGSAGDNVEEKEMTADGSPASARSVTMITNDDTKIVVNGKRGSLSDVARATFVQAFGETQSDGSVAATLVVAGDQPVGPSAQPAEAGDDNARQLPSRSHGVGSDNGQLGPSSDDGQQLPSGLRGLGGDNRRPLPSGPQGSANRRLPPSSPQGLSGDSRRRLPPPPQGLGDDERPWPPFPPQGLGADDRRGFPPPPPGLREDDRPWFAPRSQGNAGGHGPWFPPPGRRDRGSADWGNGHDRWLPGPGR
jgi:hypothetical protein